MFEVLDCENWRFNEFFEEDLLMKVLVFVMIYCIIFNVEKNVK